jgi:succinoglycan biosynthesis transport protein ExoP
MSHIQKILERAERDGSIRPSAPAHVAERSAAAVGTSDAVFPIPPVLPAEPPLSSSLLTGVAPAVVPASARRHVASTMVSPAVMEALRSGSASADQYRTLRTRIQQSANGRSINALVVTSPSRREGRTHTAASLALSMTKEFDRRVCIMDANLRAPHLRDVFGLPEGPGLSDVLTERARLEDALVHIDDLNITVFPGGEATTQPELLGSIAMRRIMQALRAQFDRIVIDAPPAIPVADVALLTPLVDGVMLVVRAGITPKPTIHEAISGINSDKLLGVVLNDKR